MYGWNEYLFEIGMFLFILLKKKKVDTLFCAFQRPVNEQKELLNKWNEMGTDEPGKVN